METEREQAEAELRADARARAAAELEAAKQETGDNPYLQSKGVGAYGLRTDGDRLLVPVRDSAGVLHGLQYISPNATKKFLTGTAVRGHYHAIGELGDRLLIGEGVATMATLHEVTGDAVAVAFDCGNLKPVAEALRGKYPDIEITICADNDQWTDDNPGLTKAREAARAVGAMLAVPVFKDTSTKPTDFNDLAALEGAEAVRQCVEDAKEADKPKARGIVTMDLAEFLATELPPREHILRPWLLKQALAMIYAWRGVGKTYVALWIAYMVAAGGEVLGWKATKARKVLYVDGEMPATALQERLARIVKSNDLEPAPGMLRLITPDLQHACMPDLATREGQRLIEAAIEPDTELVILDNLSCLVRRGGRENEAESWLNVAEWALSLRARGISLLLIHHSGKDGNQRGTSKREDQLDTVIVLKRPPGYLPQDGAVFELHYDKCRELRGKDVLPIEARLTEDERGRQIWTTRLVEESTYDRVAGLARDGLAQHEIADGLGLTRSKVSRLIKKAKAEGVVVDLKDYRGRRRPRKDTDD